MPTTFPTHLCLMVALSLATATAHADEAGWRIAEADVKQWNTLISQQPPGNIEDLLTDDALLIGPDGSTSRSRAAIRAVWENLLATSKDQYRLKLLDVRRENDDTLVSRIELTDLKPLVKAGTTLSYRYQGVVSHVLKRLPGGGWKVQVQRWRAQDHY